jgi:hypothetical protein
MADTSIIKELNQIILMNEMVLKKAARLKNKIIAGGVSTPPHKKTEALIDNKHVKAIATRRENFIKKKIA